MADPLFLFELAESQQKSVRELTTGEPGMSAHELCVLWPAYHAHKRRQRERKAEVAEKSNAQVPV